MRLWQSQWRTLVALSQQNPPQVVETLMLLLAVVLLLVWTLLHSWPYLVLSLSYIVGASVSILVREAIAPSHRSWLARTSTILSICILVLSLYKFANLIFSS